LMLGVVRVKLETEEEALNDLPVGFGSYLFSPLEGNCAELSLLKGVLGDGCESGEKRSSNGFGTGHCPAENDRRCEDSSKELHLFLSFCQIKYYNLYIASYLNTLSQ
jgi:hypothetical protein